MALWYYHCKECGHHFRLGKATKHSLDKVKTLIYCPRCQSTKIEPSWKCLYDEERGHHGK